MHEGDVTIRLLNAADGSEVRRIPVDGYRLTCMAFLPAGDVLATAWQDNSVRLWDVATGKPLGPIETNREKPQSYSFSADGKTLVVDPWIEDGKAVFHAYAVPGGKDLGSYESLHTRDVRVVASADGKMLASWGDASMAPSEAEQKRVSRTVQLWDTAGGNELRRIETDCGAVTCAAFSPNNEILALACERGTIQFWDPAKGRLLRTFQGQLTFGHELAFAPDGKTFFVPGLEGRIQAWDVESGKRLPSALGPPGLLWSLAVAPSGQALACSLDGEALAVWDVRTGKVLATKAGHKAPVGAVAFAEDGKSLWSAGFDGDLFQWDAASGKELRRMPQRFASDDNRRHNSPWVETLRFSPGGKYLAYGDDPGNSFVALRQTATNEEVLWFPTCRALHPSEGFAAAFSPDGSLFAFAEGVWQATDVPHILVWDADSGRELVRLKGCKVQPSALAISPDGKTLALAGWTDSLQIPGGAWEAMLWDIENGKEPRRIKQYAAPRIRRGELPSLAYAPDGRLLAVVDGNGGVAVWDVAAGRDRWQADSVEELVLAPAVFSPDGRLLAVASQLSGSEEGKMRLWEVASGQVRREFADRFGPVLSLAFSPDGRVLAAGCQDTTILLWDAAGTQAGGAQLKKDLKADALDALWADLASADSAAADRAVAQLAAAPADAVPYLKRRVPPVEGKTAGEAVIARLVADLDADDFDVREKAGRELADLGTAAGPVLRKSLAGEPPPELQRRAEELLAKLDKPDLSPETLRLRRAVEALERTGDPAARDILEALARGRSGADVTEDARAALKRLDRRP